MRNFLRNSIRSQLTFWFLVMALLPLFIAITFAYKQRVKAAEQRSKEKIIAIRDLKVDKLNTWIDEIIRDLDVMAGSYEIKSLEHSFKNKIKSPDDIKKITLAKELLNKNKRNFNRYLDLNIININTNRIEISTDKNNIGIDATKHLKNISTLKPEDVYIEEIHTSLDIAPRFSITKPIICQEPNKHIIGYLAVKIDLDNTLYPILDNKIGLGNTGETLLVNKEGFAINKLRWRRHAPLNLKITAEPAIRAIAGNTGTIISKDYRGVLVLAAYTYMPKMKWGFVCKQDIGEINAPILKMNKDFMYLFIITVLFILVITFFLSKTISNPIIRLNKETKKITKGNFSSTINIRETDDEIGSLSRSISKMTKSLHSKTIIQEGVTSISKTIIKQTSLNQFSTDLLKQLIVVTKNDYGVFYVLNELTSKFEPFTNIGFPKDSLNSICSKEGEFEFTKDFLSGSIIHNKTYNREIFFNSKFLKSKDQPNEVIIIPIKVENIIVAIILIATHQHYTEESVAIVTQSSTNINTSYSSLLSNLRVGILAENVLKIYEELEIKTNKLTKQNRVLLKQKTISKEAIDELEAFSYSVSHDLRAPLRHIDGFTKLLNKSIDHVDENSQKYFDNIVSATKQMNRLIEDLLIFSRMGRKDVNKSKTNMKKIVDNAIKTFESEIKEIKVTITVDKLQVAQVDSSLFMQVWLNLISNAIKFTSKTKKPKIHIGSFKNAEGHIIYFIKDNGVGFNQKFVDKVFGVFQRLHSNAEFPGTGIGLASVKRIIKKHGGDIWAEGEINKGASFFIKLTDE